VIEINTVSTSMLVSCQSGATFSTMLNPKSEAGRRLIRICGVNQTGVHLLVTQALISQLIETFDEFDWSGQCESALNERLTIISMGISSHNR
jgi:hypothetical protein